MIRLDTLDTPITDGHLKELEPALASLQGNILRGHKRERAVHLFLRFQPDKQPAVREKLCSIATDDTVTSASQQDTSPDSVFCSVFLSAAGYYYLDPKFLFGFSAEFQSGMKGAQERLQDPAPGDGDYAQNFHAMVLLAHSDLGTLRKKEQTIREHFESVTEFRKVEWGKVLRDPVTDRGIENFGYADGISQPLFFQKDLDKYGYDKQQGAREWDPSAGPSLVLMQDPNGGQDDFGSYLVFRKLEQNVQGFVLKVEELAHELKLDPDLAGAFAIGRFRDSTPVALYKTAGTPDTPLSNFSFSDDPEGGRCPYHAHIRKLNPRDDVASGRDRRIARRGITYGDGEYGQRLKEPKDNPTIDELPTHRVGLLFLCYQRDIARQFEFLQSRWANNPNFLHTATGVDPVIGCMSGKAPVAQRWPTAWGAPREEHKPFDFESFVKFQGGEYFFAPSIHFLKSL